MNIANGVEEQLRQWVSPGSKLLVAVSGGPDSVALAHLLRGLPYPVCWGHVDHQIRKNSSRDAHFVESLAKRWAVPAKISKMDVPLYARGKRLGLEEAARELRYLALGKMAQQARCSAVLTAHTQDDQAETVLMNLLRGTGPLGLAGIPPIRRLKKRLSVLRPFLRVSRFEILSYLKKNKLPFREDPTNRQRRFTRNRIRHETIPFLEKNYPGLKRRLACLGDLFREEESFWEQEVDSRFPKTVRKDGQKVAVDLVRLLGYHKALRRRILRRAIGTLPFEDLERILTLTHNSGQRFPLDLANGIKVMRKDKELIIHGSWRMG